MCVLTLSTVRMVLESGQRVRAVHTFTSSLGEREGGRGGEEEERERKRQTETESDGGR